MANLIGDTEENRYLDRIKAVVWKEAMGCGAVFITRKWISQKLHRSESWVKRNWNKSYDDCKSAEKPGKVKEPKMSSWIHQRRGKKSCAAVAQEILAKRGRQIQKETVRIFRHKDELKPRHIIKKPKKTNRNIEDRL